MNRKEFKKQYQTKEWYETSKLIKSRDLNTCQMCGRNDLPLSVHHRYYGENGSLDVPHEALITLCESCHRIETEAKSSIYDDVAELINEFSHKGLSLDLLKNLISGIYEVINLLDLGELDEKQTPAKYFLWHVYSTQNISDIFTLKKMGVDCRDLIENFYPDFLQKYDSIG